MNDTEERTFLLHLTILVGNVLFYPHFDLYKQDMCGRAYKQYILGHSFMSSLILCYSHQKG